MNTAAAKVLPFPAATRSKQGDTGMHKGTGEIRPCPPSLKVSMDLIDRFDEASNHLAAFLDGLFKIGTSYDSPKPETIVFFADQAEECLKEMEAVFEEITGKKEGK